MMRGSQARSSLPQGWSQTVESRINIGLDKERDFYKLQRIFDLVRHFNQRHHHGVSTYCKGSHRL